ncbi:hypothetical protein PILCRDRAFT_9053 [Piloderma croceum F 1598]|uniref:Uncharacterized protein n=1 Tax=Piloderma croceum (strain F 1598) TaxID=765440 RepID=A0A0C3BUH9_PILCF|nr:hypothetical protein PILCRDRAFT_9053 [Piloderma croceum F 1598]
MPDLDTKLNDSDSSEDSDLPSSDSSSESNSEEEVEEVLNKKKKRVNKKQRRIGKKAVANVDSDVEMDLDLETEAPAVKKKRGKKRKAAGDADMEVANVDSDVKMDLDLETEAPAVKKKRGKKRKAAGDADMDSDLCLSATKASRKRKRRALIDTDSEAEQPISHMKAKATIVHTSSSILVGSVQPDPPPPLICGNDPPGTALCVGGDGRPNNSPLVGGDGQPNISPPVGGDDQPDTSPLAASGKQPDTPLHLVGNNVQSDTGPFSPPIFVKGTWLQKPLNEISKVDLSPSYNKLLTLLCKLEMSYKWINKTRGFPKITVERPAQLTHWVQDGRRGGTLPLVSNIPLYCKTWWMWWIALQPERRNTERPLVRTAYGDSWTSLMAPGANGILGVVATLYWWGKAIVGNEGEESVTVKEEWLEAVSDVTWMVEGLLRHVEAKTKKT